MIVMNKVKNTCFMLISCVFFFFLTRHTFLIQFQPLLMVSINNLSFLTVDPPLPYTPYTLREFPEQLTFQFFHYNFSPFNNNTTIILSTRVNAFPGAVWLQWNFQFGWRTTHAYTNGCIERAQWGGGGYDFPTGILKWFFRRKLHRIWLVLMAGQLEHK